MNSKFKLLTYTDKGLYCPVADVYIDPSRTVERAVITHAHADHARRGHRWYLAHRDSEPVLRLRLGEISLQTVEYGQLVDIKGVKFSLHPAGHAIGSAQVRVEYQGEVWVVSGDYKVEDDGLSVPFEPVKCNVFVSEATFGLPVFDWQPQQAIFDQIHSWWVANQAQGITSVINCYAFGKAQRIAYNLDLSIGKLLASGAIVSTNSALRAHGIDLPEITTYSTEMDLGTALILSTGNISQDPVLSKLPAVATAQVSGWMQLRRMRNRDKLMDKAFAMSDHADWKGLNQAIRATEAEVVYVTHGYTHVLAQWLNSQGIEAYPLQADTLDLSAMPELELSDNAFVD